MRPKLPLEKHKILFNCYLDPDVFDRLKTICFRLSVKHKKRYSEGQLVRSKIIAMRMPKAPTKEHIDAYIALYPENRKKIIDQAAQPTPAPLPAIS